MEENTKTDEEIRTMFPTRSTARRKGDPRRIGTIEGLSTEHTGYLAVRFVSVGFAECVHWTNLVRA